MIRWLRETAGEVLRVAGRSLEVRRHTMPWHLGCDASGGTANPYSLAVVLPFVRFWCERDGGKYWPWDRTILRLVVGKQEFRVDLALNCWGIGVDLVETDDWSIHLGPLDIECEYDKFYDLDDEWIRPADLRLFSKVREPCECEREPVRHD